MKREESKLTSLRELIDHITHAESNFFEIQEHSEEDTLKDWMVKYCLERNAFKLKLKGVLAEYETGDYRKNGVLNKINELRMDLKLHKILNNHASIIEKLETDFGPHTEPSYSELHFRKKVLPYRIKREFFGSNYFKEIWAQNNMEWRI